MPIGNMREQILMIFYRSLVGKGDAVRYPEGLSFIIRYVMSSLLLNILFQIIPSLFARLTASSSARLTSIPVPFMIKSINSAKLNPRIGFFGICFHIFDRMAVYRHNSVFIKAVFGVIEYGRSTVHEADLLLRRSSRVMMTIIFRYPMARCGTLH